ncbi:hypothetical protein HNY73_002267 [Argiope bruennichi]|uniref:Uncharacterized protein n=1 Tax=Argiope bruennichi TaxID=94029 RepID=A0A8T0FXF3_ARGBR|nr:hypothetical protein HNY73_002267 [Argiope bruennichi]
MTEHVFFPPGAPPSFAPQRMNTSILLPNCTVTREASRLSMCNLETREYWITTKTTGSMGSGVGVFVSSHHAVMSCATYLRHTGHTENPCVSVHIIEPAVCALLVSCVEFALSLASCYLQSACPTLEDELPTENNLAFTPRSFICAQI